MAKFVQIVSHSGSLYALDERGEVWVYAAGMQWSAVETKRGPSMLEIRERSKEDSMRAAGIIR